MYDPDKKDHMLARNQMKNIHYRLVIEHFDGLYSLDRRGENDRTESSWNVNWVSVNFCCHNSSSQLEYFFEDFLIHPKFELKIAKVNKRGRFEGIRKIEIGAEPKNFLDLTGSKLPNCSGRRIKWNVTPLLGHFGGRAGFYFSLQSSTILRISLFLLL